MSRACDAHMRCARAAAINPPCMYALSTRTYTCDACVTSYVYVVMIDRLVDRCDAVMRRVRARTCMIEHASHRPCIAMHASCRSAAHACNPRATHYLRQHAARTWHSGIIGTVAMHRPSRTKQRSTQYAMHAYAPPRAYNDTHVVRVSCNDG